MGETVRILAEQYPREYRIWKEHRRSSAFRSYVPWNDFARFLEDVGPQPDGTVLKRRPYGHGSRRYGWADIRQIGCSYGGWHHNGGCFVELLSRYQDDELEQRLVRRGLPYRLTSSEVRALVQHSSGMCVVCSRHASIIEHCHFTGTVRGIVCEACNRALTEYDDSGASQWHPEWNPRLRAYVAHSLGIGHADTHVFTHPVYMGRVTAKGSRYSDDGIPAWATEFPTWNDR